MTNPSADDHSRDLAEVLERRAADPVYASFIGQYLDALAIDPDATVLDIGCGTGVVTRTIARRVGSHGSVIGIDLDGYLISEGRRKAADARNDAPIAFLTGDVHDLPFRDGTFDVVAAHTAISHVDDPPRALGEAARVLRPGGSLVVFEADDESRVYDCPDGALADQMRQAMQTHADPVLVRKLPRLLTEAGLELTEGLSFVQAEIGTGDVLLDRARRLAEHADDQSRSTAAAWYERLRQASEQGTFFAACNHYAVIGRRPSG